MIRTPDDTDPTAPSRLIGARYRLGDLLGRSLMSEVRRGEDVRLKRSVAIKLLRADGDPCSVERFEREAKILASLHHPNVVTVFDAGVDGSDRFIVMELVEGPTLRELLDNDGPLPLERASEIADGVASALGFAHGRGIVHRDVKPSNVLLRSDGSVKLVDMGIARLLSQEALTLTMNVLGTARYMSPEQARGDRLDGRSDIYSLGCVLFEVLTGRTPFDGSPLQLSYAHVNTPAPRVRSIDPAVPAAMDELVASMLEKDPASRPQTAERIQGSLASAAKSHDAVMPTAVLERLPRTPAPIARPPAVGRRKPRPKAWPTIVIAACGLAVLLLVALLASGRPDDPASASGRLPRQSSSPATSQPSPVETSSPATEQPSPVESSSPATQQPSPAETISPALEPASPEEAAAVVLDVVGDGIETDEITGHIDHEIDHTIDEILRETSKGEDLEKSLEKVDDLREKVSEALEKGEITSADRASAIEDALMGFADALRDAEQ